MTIQLQDTLSGETRPLEPLEPGHVRIYSCGPTVYGPAHVGNFRSFLFADLLVRYLRYRGLRVTWVMNITDIDDKIIKGAAAAGEPFGTLTERYIGRFLEDAAALRMTTPDVDAAGDRSHRRDRRPHRVALEQAAIAYRTDDGSIFFRIASWPALRPPRPARSRPACGSASGSRPTSTARTTSATSPCGRAPKPGEPSWDTELGTRPAGLAHRVLGDEHGSTSGRRSTSTPAAST